MDTWGLSKAIKITRIKSLLWRVTELEKLLANLRKLTIEPMDLDLIADFPNPLPHLLRANFHQSCNRRLRIAKLSVKEEGHFFFFSAMEMV